MLGIEIGDKRLDDLSTLFESFKIQGWVAPNHLAHNGKQCWIIEAGSVGIFEGYADNIGYWVVEPDDVYPSHPFVVYLKPEEKPYAQIYYPTTVPT